MTSQDTSIRHYIKRTFVKENVDFPDATYSSTEYKFRFSLKFNVLAPLYLTVKRLHWCDRADPWERIRNSKTFYFAKRA